MTVILFILLILFAGAYQVFEPELDRLSTGERIVWYNSGGKMGTERSYFKLRF